MIALPESENRMIVSSFIWTKHRDLTAQTDRQTDLPWLLQRSVLQAMRTRCKNQSVEWLHVLVVRGSQKAFAIKNRVVSLHHHAEPLEEELGLAIITRPL